LARPLTGGRPRQVHDVRHGRAREADEAAETERRRVGAWLGEVDRVDGLELVDLALAEDQEALSLVAMQFEAVAARPRVAVELEARRSTALAQLAAVEEDKNVIATAVAAKPRQEDLQCRGRRGLDRDHARGWFFDEFGNRQENFRRLEHHGQPLAQDSGIGGAGGPVGVDRGPQQLDHPPRQALPAQAVPSPPPASAPPPRAAPPGP